LTIDGYNERQKQEWERTRAVVFNIHRHTALKKHANSAQKFWPFPWDRRNGVKVAQSAKEVWEEHQRMKALKQKNIAS
jgi:cytochrome c556